jgi:hypothetical protein
MAMVPHERSLVERLEGKPFVVLGVNADDDRATMEQTIKDRDITWRSWWDDDDKIRSQWGADGFPYLVLIDGTGVIREIIPGRPRDSSYLDRAVDQLLQETQ